MVGGYCSRSIRFFTNPDRLNFPILSLKITLESLVISHPSGCQGIHSTKFNLWKFTDEEPANQGTDVRNITAKIRIRYSTLRITITTFVGFCALARLIILRGTTIIRQDWSFSKVEREIRWKTQKTNLSPKTRRDKYWTIRKSLEWIIRQELQVRSRWIELCRLSHSIDPMRTWLQRFKVFAQPQVQVQQPGRTVDFAMSNRDLFNIGSLSSERDTIHLSWRRDDRYWKKKKKYSVKPENLNLEEYKENRLRSWKAYFL